MNTNDLLKQMDKTRTLIEQVHEKGAEYLKAKAAAKTEVGKLHEMLGQTDALSQDDEEEGDEEEE